MYEGLKQILMTTFRVPPADITPQATLAELGLDSLDLVELSFAIEQDLSAQVSDDELAELEQVGELVALIEARSARSSRAV
jgi:acyl carrier protein